jgi:DNA replication protein DnaC
MTDIPALYKDATLDNVAKEIVDVVKEKPCYLWGPVGSGKTYILYALLKYFQEQNRGGILTTFSDLLLRIRQSYDRKFTDQETEREIIRSCRETRIFMIDDLSATADKETDFSLRILNSILDHRVNNCLPTYFTSNRPPEEIKKAFDERIFSRIVGNCEIVKVVGKDRRIR